VSDSIPATLSVTPIREIWNPILFSLIAIPNLVHFWWLHGTSVHLDVLVTHVDAPLLHSVKIMFFNQPSSDVSELPHFIDFICRAAKLMSLDKADLCFSRDTAEVKLSPQIETEDDTTLSLGILCRESYGPPSLSNVFHSSTPPPLSHSLLLNASKSAWNIISGRNGNMARRTFKGSDFYARLLMWRISPYPRNLPYASRLLGRGRQGREENQGAATRASNHLFEGLQPSNYRPFQEAIR